LIAIAIEDEMECGRGVADASGCADGRRGSYVNAAVYGLRVHGGCERER